MVFSSTIFLFIFLPIVIILNYLLNNRYRNTFLLLSSLFFYAWGEGLLVILMIVSICVNYIFGIGIAHFFSRKKASKIILGLGVCVNLSFLLYYKYANFIIENLIEVGLIQTYSRQSILLPIGISFFTFQGISYIIDVYRKDTPVQKNPLHLGLYISFFPQLIAGPIVRYHDIAKQIKERTTSKSLFSEGVIRFIRGLAKKVIIANTAALIADKTFAIPVDQLPALVSWLGIVCYSLQIYFDFSGYSDMAIGLGKMFGFTFKENFNYPYISKSIQDFWRRWHISLSTWFRDYLYIPMGGSRVPKSKIYRNLIIVFFVTGLWHGASWNFIIWGLFHGLFLLLERSGVIKINKMPNLLKHFYVLLVVVIGWVFFRVETLNGALLYLKTMIGFTNGNNYEPLIYFNNYTTFILVLGVLFSLPIRVLFNEYTEKLKKGWTWNIYTISKYSFYIFIFLISIIELAKSSYNPFIYFRF